MHDHHRIRALLDARRPGHTLPQPFYTDPDLYRFDLDAVFARSWIAVGFECEVAEPGSYLAARIGASPIVITRARDGALRGFHNACRHRGAQLCAEGAGRRSLLVCPYHQWSYGLDGRLVRAARMGENFDPAEHGLVPVRVEAVAGTLYACLAEDAPDFAPFRREVEPLLAPLALQDAKVAHVDTLVERGNWKLVMENARECYHCDAKHPELSFTFPTGARGNFESEGDPARIAFDDRMAARGLPVGPVDGDWYQAARFALNDGCASMTEDGRACVARPLAALTEGDVGSLRWALEPHSFAHAVGDFAFLFSAMPTGPRETVVTSKWLVHRDAVEGVDYDLGTLTALWTATNLQDRDLVENNQRGVDGAGYRPGPYSPEGEALCARFTDWYCRKARDYLDAVAPARRLEAAE
ncbi:aromatic ring-hydroxylating oxygenase subunit alpha [Lichenibacterium dinghuense]|uniref:aromatic ring-hydroxylating oxygenase subunit alpha n=1 Tax=Lichenibacterium dinghuense TaxID=2895977 RepID=UPI001F2D7586|nr:aromatic ring-hydroxylating dioxygenase subunit alpha [Lichenibacterium sp. 6Y81]